VLRAIIQKYEKNGRTATATMNKMPFFVLVFAVFVHFSTRIRGRLFFVIARFLFFIMAPFTGTSICFLFQM
jgi:hypothetical protein